MEQQVESGGAAIADIRREGALNEIDDGEANDETADSPSDGALRQPNGRGPLWLALGITTAVWVPLFALRVQAHQANVDDFLYAATARAIGDHIDLLSGALHTGQTAPLVPTLAAPGAHLAGLYGAMAIQLPMLLLAVSGAFLLARVWLRPWESMVTALLVGLNVEMLGYAVMLHFAVACSAAVLWSFAAYLRSDRLHTWPWSVVFGVSVAALLLSRSVALIYVAPMAVVIVVDLTVEILRHGRRPGPPVLASLILIVVIAGPWWLISGPTAVHYLVSAGYQSSGGYISASGARFNPSAMEQRIRGELAYLGWAESWVLGIAIVVAVCTAIPRWGAVRSRRSGALVAWVVASVIILMTSSNLSTALGLPVVAVLIVLCAAPISRLPVLPLRGVVVVLTLVVLVGIGSQAATGPDLWWPPPPYRSDVIQSGGGSARTDSDLITAQVSRLAGSTPTLVVNGDPVLNPNGLLWNARRDAHLIILLLGSQETREALDQLQHADLLVTTTSPTSFYDNLDQRAVETAAAFQGFQPTHLWTVSPTTNVVLWQRMANGHHAPSIFKGPRTFIDAPKPGATLDGSFLLAASASDPVGVLKVEFDVTGGGGGAPVVIPAKPYLYGWLGGWVTTSVPNGTYVVRSVATDFGGEIGTSAPISVTVHN